MKSIIVQYRGPGNTRGSRMRASDQDGNSITVSYDHSLNLQENQDAAAVALCFKMNWAGTLNRGSLKHAEVYTWIDSTSTLRVCKLKADPQQKGGRA